MSDIVTPRDLPNELIEITNQETLIEIYNPDTARNEKIDKGNFNIDGVRLSKDRIALQELISGSLSVSGWYTITDTDISGNQTYSSLFSINWRKASTLIQATITASGSAKTHLNSNIEMISRGYEATVNRIEGIRIAKSDSVNGAGFKLQIKIDASSPSELGVQKLGNISRVILGAEGWNLVDPYLDNTPTLPDGVTAGTFLEAGEELAKNYIGRAAFDPRIMCYKATNDILRVVTNWGEIAKLGTVITITDPSTGIDLVDGEGVTVTLDIAGSTISNVNIEDNIVQFQINDTGHFTTLNSGITGMRPNGSGFAITIT